MKKSKHPRRVPYMVYADSEGNIREDKRFEVAGRSGNQFVKLQPEDFIELPVGSEFFTLPNRKSVGINKKGEPTFYPFGNAVAAFVSPAHTQTYMAAFEREPNAPILPLYAYTAVGWLDETFWATCVRIDPDIRQDWEQFDNELMAEKAKHILAQFPENRLIQHIGNNCALTYFCPAARNYFLGRWECPIPSSPACNANCVGCISFQPKEHTISSTQDRLTFIPTPDEIVQIAVPHLENAPRPIISFGQGCEGEPLLVWDVLCEAIKEIRKKTKKGIININTNGSRPDAVEKMCQAGLQSIRVSTNSVQKQWYENYYLPNNYEFEDILESAKIVRKYKGWASFNYFSLPGFTDSIAEYEALRKAIKYTDLTMIQWRNFNIDPDWYMVKIRTNQPGEAIGMRHLMKKLKDEFPHLTYGYFNPPEHIIQKRLAAKELIEAK
jgi:wyosine [tRNA(Phe)-imidazoG37] synthetase (radical SAM superfamily)